MDRVRRLRDFILARNRSEPPKSRPEPPPYAEANTKTQEPEDLKAFLTRYRPSDLGCDIVLRFESKVKTGSDYWEAFLVVRSTSGVAKIMKEGLHVDKSNIVPESGGVRWPSDPTFSKPSFHRNTRWKVARWYVLQDKRGEDGGGKWKAQCIVLASDISAVSRFRLANLSSQSCLDATAWNRDDTVYNFSAKHPETNLNAYYDNMPLAGLWPWPKVAVEKDGT